MAAELTPEMERHIKLFVDQYLRSYTYELDDLKAEHKETREYLAITIVFVIAAIKRSSGISTSEEIELQLATNAAFDQIKKAFKEDCNPLPVAQSFMEKWAPYGFAA